MRKQVEELKTDSLTDPGGFATAPITAAACRGDFHTGREEGTLERFGRSERLE